MEFKLLNTILDPNSGISECYKTIECLREPVPPGPDPTPTPTPDPKPKNPDEKSKRGFPWLGVILILLGILLWVYYARNEKKKKEKQQIYSESPNKKKI